MLLQTLNNYGVVERGIIGVADAFRPVAAIAEDIGLGNQIAQFVESVCVGHHAESSDYVSHGRTLAVPIMVDDFDSRRDYSFHLVAANQFDVMLVQEHKQHVAGSNENLGSKFLNGEHIDDGNLLTVHGQTQSALSPLMPPPQTTTLYPVLTLPLSTETTSTTFSPSMPGMSGTKSLAPVAR